MQSGHKSGFIAIIGRPNVGKSTFLNRVLGQKVAIMSDKAQTTRNKIQGVFTEDDAQMIFIDTPGIHKPKHRLGDFMVKIAEQTLNEVDMIMFMINADEGFGKGDGYIIEKLKNVKNRPVFLVINKIDLIHPDDIFPLIEQYRHMYDFSEVVPISSLEGNNVSQLLSILKNNLPCGPVYYPEDHITDHPERFIISELIREKILHFTKEEIPHSVTVIIEHIESRNDGSLLIQAAIITERKSQKGILIGKQGSMIKKVRKQARHDIERLLGQKIEIELWVKVQKDWRNRQNYLHEYGYKQDDY
ncbi:MAG TPA: GTPase Era [Bacillota bacterium]|nr:GTPase Era [Bacillota bacterium]